MVDVIAAAGSLKLRALSYASSVASVKHPRPAFRYVSVRTEVVHGRSDVREDRGGDQRVSVRTLLQHRVEGQQLQ